MAAVSTEPAGDRRAPDLLDWRVARNDFAELPDCLGKPVDACTVVHGDGQRVVLVGDSHAWAYLPTFTDIARERSWELSVLAHPTCLWQKGLQIVFTTFEECREHQADWFDRVLPTLDPQLMILTHQALDSPMRPTTILGDDDLRLDSTVPGYDEGLIDATAAVLAELRRPGRELVLLEPLPDHPADFDPLACLSAGEPPASCAFTAARGVTPLERFYRAEGRKPDTTTLDLDRLVCPNLPRCDAIIDDVIVRRDAPHLTATFARALASRVAALIPE